MSLRLIHLAFLIIILLCTTNGFAQNEIILSTPYASISEQLIARVAESFENARFTPPPEAIRKSQCNVIYQELSREYLMSHYEPQREKWREKGKEFFLKEVAPKMHFNEVRDEITSEAIYIMKYLENPEPADPKEYYEKVLKGTSAVNAFSVDSWVSEIQHAKRHPKEAEEYLRKWREIKTPEDFYELQGPNASFGAFRASLVDRLQSANKFSDEQVEQFAKQFGDNAPEDKAEKRRYIAEGLFKLALINVVSRDLKVHDPTWGDIFKAYLKEQKQNVEAKLQTAGIDVDSLKLSLFEQPHLLPDIFPNT